MVARLAKLGYVGKRADPEDSRAVVVEATARGRRVVRARRDHLREKHRLLLARLSPEDQDRFVAATRTIVTLMQSALGAAAGEHDNA
jgi:DNA-binding MarR family transcriptional regulator